MAANRRSTRASLISQGQSHRRSAAEDMMELSLTRASPRRGSDPEPNDGFPLTQSIRARVDGGPEWGTKSRSNVKAERLLWDSKAVLRWRLSRASRILGQAHWPGVTLRSHGEGQRPSLSDEHHQAPTPRNRGVDQVPLQHRVVRGRQRMITAGYSEPWLFVDRRRVANSTSSSSSPQP